MTQLAQIISEHPTSGSWRHTSDPQIDAEVRLAPSLVDGRPKPLPQTLLLHKCATIAGRETPEHTLSWTSLSPPCRVCRRTTSTSSDAGNTDLSWRNRLQSD
ncbi:hypothetical protein QC764_0039900 [Podospora pseudoanserina]|uniref:Uncharacterized protein n=1 Tax=Podospora pseudoanserina TaxID=2609844 RepID=A0ABR0IHR8_9PEZI|nr:hypothetical protein QC764_0039900 [Podospora pseudoanserina]